MFNLDSLAAALKTVWCYSFSLPNWILHICTIALKHTAITDVNPWSRRNVVTHIVI